MASIKISADTSPVKKSLLDISKQLKDLKGTKVSIFTQEDKRFIKQEMKREMDLLKQKIKDNRDEISKMVETQRSLTKGTKDELEVRKKILDAYKTQAKLGKQLGQVKAGGAGIPGGGGGGILDKLASGLGALGAMIPKMLGAGAVATAGFAVYKGIQATGQYVSGAPNRNRLRGLGVDDQNFGSADQLARAGLTEQDMIQRRVEATSVLGRQGTSNQTEMGKAAFERAFGLEGGTMTGVASQFRGQVGGQGATDMQMKIQASILASGIEDAIGPYLDSAVSLLTSINENGTANTEETTNLLAQLSKDGERTPELIARAFQGVNNAIKGASGEASAFLQTAFARSGIGGGTIGGTKFAMSSGGLMGLSRDQLEKRGYNKQLLDNMQKSGFFSGVGERTGAILNQFRESGGLKAGQKFGGITNPDQMVGMNNLANKVFGTQGEQGFDVLQMLEKVQSKQMTQKQFDSKLKEMQEKSNPTLERLDKINSSLSGQTEILTLINTNLMEALGKQGVVTRNELTKIENEGIKATTTTAGAINQTGVVRGAGSKAVSGMQYTFGGGIGEDAFNMMNPKNPIEESRDQERETSRLREWHRQNKMRASQGKEPLPPPSREQLTARSIGEAVADAMEARKTVTETIIRQQLHLPDGTVTERTQK